MFGFNFEAAIIDSRLVKLILPCLIFQKYNWFCLQDWFYLKLEIVTSSSIIDSYIQIFCSTHFCMNISKYKSFYLQINFSQNQFYRINYVKINFLTLVQNQNLSCQKRRAKLSTGHAESVFSSQVKSLDKQIE
jgi:hypothetical protein